MMPTRRLPAFQLGALATLGAVGAMLKPEVTKEQRVYLDELADHIVSQPPHKPYTPHFTGLPHQGKRECERRMKQMAKAKAKMKVEA